MSAFRSLRHAVTRFLFRSLCILVWCECLPYARYIYSLQRKWSGPWKLCAGNFSGLQKFCWPQDNLANSHHDAAHMACRMCPQNRVSPFCCIKIYATPELLLKGWVVFTFLTCVQWRWDSRSERQNGRGHQFVAHPNSQNRRSAALFVAKVNLIFNVSCTHSRLHDGPHSVRLAAQSGGVWREYRASAVQPRQLDIRKLFTKLYHRYTCTEHDSRFLVLFLFSKCLSFT